MRGVFVGLATLDVVHYVERLPGPDEKVSSTLQNVGVGGPAANAARVFAALGGHARLVTALGASPLARLVKDDLARDGVQVEDVAPDLTVDPPVSSVAVTRETGERSIVSREVVPVPMDVPASLTNVLSGAEVMLLDGHHPALAVAAASWAKQAQIETVLDVGRAKPVFDDLLLLAGTAICSAGFRLADHPNLIDTVRGLQSLGVQRIAFTHGGQPVRWWAERRHGQIIPDPIPAADTLGAGDALHGAFCLYQGTLAFPDALTRAVQLATDRCETRGFRSWLQGLRAT